MGRETGEDRLETPGSEGGVGRSGAEWKRFGMPGSAPENATATFGKAAVAALVS